jgi:hypothetical protein
MANEFAPFEKETTYFIVKNIADSKKVVRIFQYPILYNKTRDLLAIPGVGEEDIRSGLLKGEIKRKIEAREILVVASNINLLQFDLQYANFLRNAGIDYGLMVTKNQLDFPVDIRLDYAWKQRIELIGPQNGSNRVFQTPEEFIEGTYGDNDFHIQVVFNGRNLIRDIDFKISQSANIIGGDGYDIITLLPFAPRADHTLYVNYATKVVYQDTDGQTPLPTDPPLVITLTGQTFAEVGDTVRFPSFEVSYSRVPQYSLLYNPDGYGVQTISGMANFASEGTFYRDVKDSARFTVTAIEGTMDTSKHLDLNWVFKTYYGVGPSWNEVIEKDIFIRSLFEDLRLATDKTINLFSGENEFIYFAQPTSYGDPSFVVQNNLIIFGKLSDNLVIRNNYGISEIYSVWSTRTSNLGQVQVNITQ